jgi:hypothetical protein
MPPGWVLIEAAKRCGWGDYPVDDLRVIYGENLMFRALCDMIQKYEQPPVDRKLLCVREAWAQLYGGEPAELEFRHGYCDDRDTVVCSIRAIELWEEGFGK